uniref:Uncharacterized protein n=1 Tax=Catharus ustulatus TaxID=91951 RepID=A0A8C3UJ77_CATUS
MELRLHMVSHTGEMPYKVTGESAQPAPSAFCPGQSCACTRPSSTVERSCLCARSAGTGPRAAMASRCTSRLSTGTSDNVSSVTLAEVSAPQAWGLADFQRGLPRGAGLRPKGLKLAEAEVTVTFPCPQERAALRV